MNDSISLYYKNERRFLAGLIDGKANDVLDVGCGAGYFGKYLKESGRASSVYGIELIKTVAEHARLNLDAVICGDLDEIDLDLQLGALDKKKFDVIVFADVLEHTKNPWGILKKISENLKDDGLLIISLPNIRHWKVLSNLLFMDRWDYEESGIMDRTHLRFFTKSTSVDLISSSGFKVVQVHSLMGYRAKTLSKITGKILEGMLAEQYVFLCKKI